MNEIVEVKRIAINLLARREHSKHELQNKLKRHAFDISTIDLVLNELAANRQQSDERFTEAYINSRINRGYGPIRIQQELRERGIKDNTLFEKYLLDNNEKWHQLANDVRLKRFGLKLPNNFKDRAKQMNFLRYRGFTQEQIHETIK